MGAKELKSGGDSALKRPYLLTKYSWVAGKLRISIANVYSNTLQPPKLRPFTSLHWELYRLINFPGKLRFHANCSLEMFNDIKEDGWCANTFTHTSLFFACKTPLGMKKSMKDIATWNRPQTCRRTQPLITNRRPFFGTRPHLSGFFHFTNIFTGVTDCDRGSRNRQSLLPQEQPLHGHTRRLNISP